MKTAKSENIILIGSSLLTSKRAIMEQIGHEIGHLKLNEIAGRKIKALVKSARKRVRK